MEQVVSADLLFRLGERTIAGDGLAIAHAHRGRRRGRLQSVNTQVNAFVLRVLGERETLLHHFRHSGLWRPRFGRLIGANHQ